MAVRYGHHSPLSPTLPETPKPRTLRPAGTIGSISLVSLPAITKSLREDGLTTPHAVRLWRHNFERGKNIAPPFALATAASLAFCGWSARGASTTWPRAGRLFFVAAGLTVAIVPFTVVFMASTNEALLRLAGKEEWTAAEERDGEALLARWRFLNGVRSVLPLAAAVLAGGLVLV